MDIVFSGRWSSNFEVPSGTPLGIDFQLHTQHPAATSIEKCLVSIRAIMLMQATRPCHASRRYERTTGRGNRILLARSLPVSIAPVPASIMVMLEDSSEAWARECLAHPLTDPDTGVQVHLLGSAHFAPRQHSRLVSIMQQLRPAALALEQPLVLSAGKGSPILPHPPFIDAFMSAWELDDLTAQPDALGPAGSPHSAADISRCLQDLEGELQSSSQSTARLGRDVLDPYECFG